MRVFLCLCAGMCCLPLHARSITSGNKANARLTVRISHLLDGKPLSLGASDWRQVEGNTLAVTRIAYLISDVSLRKADGTTVQVPDQVAYINPAEGRESFTLPLVPTGNYAKLTFHIGLTPRVNHADPARYPSGHPLHPLVNRLHWGWQGGYVFLALEGRYKQANGSTRGFSYHIATDRHRMTVRLSHPFQMERDSAADIAFDLSRMFAGPHPLRIQPEHGGDSTHSAPGDRLATQLAENAQQAFRLEGMKPEYYVEQKREVAPSTGSATKIAAGTNNAGTRRPARTTPYTFPTPPHFPQPNLPADNPLTVEGIALGKKLFFDPRLSGNNTLACAGCHRPQSAFSDRGKAVSTGIDGKPGTRRAMPLFNLAWQSAFTWDGRRTRLRDQALAPIQDAREMHQTLEQTVAKLRADAQYPTLFARAFGGSVREVALIPSPSPNPGRREHQVAFNPQPASRLGSREHYYSRRRTEILRSQQKVKNGSCITADHIGLAIEQYLLTLISADAKFDQALRGEAPFTDEEKRGLMLFITEYDPARGKTGADCFHCHGGNLFTDYQFRNNGLDTLFKDAGRFLVTGREGDRGKFKTPSLRNVELTGPYMHDGRFRTLEDAVRHYMRPVRRSDTLDPNIAKHPDEGMALPNDDVHALIAFLKTLTDADYKR